MKKYLLGFILASSLVTSAYAVRNGFFMGLQVGQSNTHNQAANVQTGLASPVTVPATVSTKGIGERALLGYNFNQYFAWEGGYTHYADATYNPGGNYGTPTIRENAFDVVVKGTFPFSDSGFGAFGKAGLGVMFISTPSSLGSSAKSTSQSVVRPAFGLGVSYDLNQNWVSDVSFSRITKGGNLKNNADLIALGISYHFVDKYCGQFLC